MAFVIDPPVIEAADDQIVLCSTKCPQAHGQIWDSPSGKVGFPLPPFPNFCVAKEHHMLTRTLPKRLALPHELL